jgi:hypothetical protein
MTRRRPRRWLDAGSFALGVLTEALAVLRRTGAASRRAPGRAAAPAVPIQIDSATRQPGRARRRPPARRARRPKP